MTKSNLRSALVPRRPLLVAALLILALVTAWLFVPTLQGHVAAMNVRSVSVTTSDTSVTDNGTELATTLTIHNPTQRDITFYSGLIHVYNGETQLTDGTSTPFERTTVPSGKTKTIRIMLNLDRDQESHARQAVKSGAIRVSGAVRGYLAKKKIEVYLQKGD